jgi:hypothetical protein
MGILTDKALKKLYAIAEQAIINSVTNTDEQALKVAALYPEWGELPDGTLLEAGMRLNHNGVLYKVNDGQSHRKQADWTPDTAVAPFSKVLIPNENVVYPWEQPISPNGYEKGAKVTHVGYTWESIYDGLNVWEPGAVGTENLWIKVEE